MRVGHSDSAVINMIASPRRKYNNYEEYGEEDNSSAVLTTPISHHLVSTTIRVESLRYIIS